jgi:adenylate cyclase
MQAKLMQGGDDSRSEKFAEKYYKGKQGLDCYLKLSEALQYGDRWNIEDNNRARRLTEEAIAMCPENPMGYLRLAYDYYRDCLLGNTKSIPETLQKCMELAQKVLAMDDSLPDVHSLLGLLYARQREFDRAIAAGERALALNPGGAYTLGNYAASLNLAGRWEEAIPLFQKAIRLNPFGPSGVYRDYGGALRSAGRYEKSVSALKKAIQISPDNITAHVSLAYTYSLMGRERDARLEVAEVLRIDPKFSLDYYSRPFLFKDQSARDKYFDALRKAGLK